MSTITPFATRASKLNSEPPPMELPLEAVLSSASSAICNGELPTSALSEGARRALTNRAKILDEALTPCPADRVAAIIAAIATMAAAPEDDLVNARLVASQYVMVVADVPEWALRKAVKDFIRGVVPSHIDFRPTAGRLREYALRLAHPFREERYRIAKVLSAKTSSHQTDEARRRVQAKFRALEQEIG